MAVTFAAASDVQTRIGRTLTSAESATVTSVLEPIADEILDAVSKSEDWYEALAAGDTKDKIVRAFKQVSIEAALRAIRNPEDTESLTETIGSYSVTRRYREGGSDAPSGLFLTGLEGRRLRRVVHGKNTGSAHVPTMIDDWWPVTEDDVIGGGG